MNFSFQALFLIFVVCIIQFIWIEKELSIFMILTAIFFLKLVQHKPQLNHQTQPFWVKGVWLVLLGAK